MSAIPSIVPEAEQRARSGFVAALGAYLLWGFLPLVFHVVEDFGAVTIVADRTIWALLLVGGIVIAGGRFSDILAVFRDRATFRTLALSSVLLACNWLIYVWAVENGQVLQSSFGYFINPLVNIAIGMVLLGERQNRWQVVAIAIALVAIAIQAIGLGQVPFIALGLALTFGFYAYFRKTAKVDSTNGLFVETLILTPVALCYLGFTFIRDGGIGFHADPAHLGLIMLTGPMTAVPLLLFAYAVKRLRLTTIGMLQYLGPSIQFILAITFFREPLSATTLLSFVLIWLSLAVYTADSYFRRGAKAVS